MIDYKNLAADIIEHILTSDLDQTEMLAGILQKIYDDGRSDGERRYQ